MLQRKICKFSLGQYSKKEDSSRLNLYTILFACSWRVRNLYFVSVASTVCVTHAFVYNAVNVNKIVIVSSTKPLHIHMRKCLQGEHYTLADVLIHGEHCEPNCNVVD